MSVGAMGSPERNLEGFVGGQTQARQGLNRRLLVDSSDIDSYIERARFGDGTGDLSVQV